MSINKYKKKPIIIEAVQWNGYNLKEIEDFVGKHLEWWYSDDPNKNPLDPFYTILKIETLEGDHLALGGDYIIKGVNGEFYPCKPDIFKKTYDLVDE